MPSMKLSGDKESILSTPSAPEYPYGLRISLSEDEVKKLDLDPLPDVGSSIAIRGMATVASVSIDDSQDGGKRRSVSLQITDLYLGGPKDAAEKMYGKESSESKGPDGKLNPKASDYIYMA